MTIDAITDCKVLVVDDDDDIRQAIARILKQCGCDVIESASVEHSFTQLQTDRVDVIFSDRRFGDELGGEDLLAHAVLNYPEIDVVMMSCSMDRRQQTDLLQKGAAICLQKPFFKDVCLKVLNELEQNRQRAASDFQIAS